MDAVLQLPDDLTEVDQWVLWRRELRGGATTKVPYSVDLRRASSTDPGDWADYASALFTLRANAHRFESGGLGFVFAGDDPFVGLDLDDCLEKGSQVKLWARGIVERFSDTYCEISPSGTGLKIWARGKILSNVAGVPCADGSIEIYSHSRYFTVTGKRFRGAPLQIEDHAQDLLALHGRLVQQKARSWPLQPLQSGRIPHGQQHSTLVSIAGTLRARRVCEEAITACLQAVNRYQCERPGTPKAIDQTVKSTRSWSAR